MICRVVGIYDGNNEDGTEEGAVGDYLSGVVEQGMGDLVA